MPRRAPSHALVASKLAAIEAEMRRIGLWQGAPLDPAKYDFHAAFAMDTMAFTQWLEFVFIPRVRSIIDAKGEFPTSSMVGVQAYRELDGAPEASALVALLTDFDALFGE
jgi:uncharacterized protein YqcC (DUF446 family)